MIAAIDHRRAIRIIFDNHFRLFHQSLKKLPVVERLFWQLGTRCSGRCREVASVDRFKQESMYGLSAGTKKSGRGREVAVTGGSTVT